MMAKAFMFPIFSALMLTADAFVFPSPPPPTQDCGWLPWEYVGCIKSGSEYRKVENRKKIALHGGANCGSEKESRTIQRCSTSEFIASTVLSTIINRGSHGKVSHSDRSTGGLKGASTTSKPKTRSRVCSDTFIDSDSGVKMLGADCRTRKRRSAQASGKLRTKRFFYGNITSFEHRDILYLIDESGSVGLDNFKKELEFVEVLSSKFSYPRHIARTATRVAVTTFASDYKHRIDLLDSSNLGDFKDGLKKIKFRGGLTCLVDTLKAARTEVFTKKGGSRVPDAVADGLIIIVTDGCYNCHDGDLRTALQTEQMALEDMGVTIVTFMVSVGGSCEDSLKALQDGSSCFRGFSFPSWKKFDDLIEYTRGMGAIDRWTKESAACP